MSKSLTVGAESLKTLAHCVAATMSLTIYIVVTLRSYSTVHRKEAKLRERAAWPGILLCKWKVMHEKMYVQPKMKTADDNPKTHQENIIHYGTLQTTTEHSVVKSNPLMRTHIEMGFCMLVYRSKTWYLQRSGNIRLRSLFMDDSTLFVLRMLGTRYEGSLAEPSCSHRASLLHVIHQLDTLTIPGNTQQCKRKSQVETFWTSQWVGC
jgi:hypothetical protein